MLSFDAWMNPATFNKLALSKCRDSLIPAIAMGFAFLLILPVCLVSTAYAAQTADRDYLLNFLTGFLDGAAHNDPLVHERFWADDLVYTAPDGIHYGKVDIMENVHREGPHPISTGTEIYSARDINLRLYGDAAVANFTLIVSVDVGETEVGHYLVSCTFIKRDGRWRTVNWQSTADKNTTPSGSFLAPGRD